MLPEEDRLFHTSMNDTTGWVIEDGAAFTLMYPEIIGVSAYC
jgi:hypothetical protein